ncbi:hypothetical protein Q7C36_019721 [Tachysurus vachellii]|uniref:Uncharacterized protein n=1 Tax=Tachysurus vachellii TaxID=175792 RepID=A0AA88LSF5_TACVA|nr:hypothetical protein Q7C36_019721 [Tachysurus vachellii]
MFREIERFEQIRVRSVSGPSQICVKFESDSCQVRVRSVSSLSQSRVRSELDTCQVRVISVSGPSQIRVRSESDPCQIKELINSDPRACHQPIEILSRSRAERPEERTGDGEASALKIRHKNPCRWCVRALAYG